MPNFGKRIDGPGGRRRASREPVVLAASAISLDATRAVVVTDVSPTGAKLEGRNLPAEGTSVLFTVGNTQLLANVVWSGRNECGIGFETPITSEVSNHLKQEGCWARVMGVTVA
jgi:hypothetical protein